ncbi:MAG: response regulator transcription factor [Chitinophagaceae bacterium]
MEKIKIAIVDDHQLFRDGLSELITGFGKYSVVIEADNGLDFIRQLDKAIPDIVLLDINMKKMDGFETAEWLKEHHPDIKILVLSMYENENAIIRMLKYGARGYVLKDIRKKELEQALSSLVTKGYYYTEMITGKLIHVINSMDEVKPGQSIRDLVSLNQREIEFLRLACTELTYKDIAEKMHLSVHTIDGYRDALFEKLHVRSRIGLAVYAIKNKIALIE